MLPIAIVGGAIGAIVSIAKGVEWVSEKVDSSQGAGSAGGKSAPAKLTVAQAASFSAALAAQTAGQVLPPSLPLDTGPISTPQMNGTDYAILDHIRAGTTAYNQVGEHYGHHAGAIAPQDPGAVSG
jgi:hypothetical protein